MEEQLNDLRKAMDDTVLKGNHFSEVQKAKIRNSVKNPNKRNRFDWFPKFLTAVFCLSFLMIMSDLTIKNIISPEKSQEQRGGGVNKDDWIVTPTFSIQSKTPEGEAALKFRGIKGKVAFLDTADFIAGENVKTRWFFWGKGLKEVNEDNFKLIGVNKVSGETKKLIDSNNWEMVNPLYSSVDEKALLDAQSSLHTVFSLPTAGLWRLDAYIGEKLYGSIVVEVKNDRNDETQSQKWNESPLFTIGNYIMIGEKGRLGFIYDNSEVLRFYPNKSQKYMWHFWGDDHEFEGKLKVVATHEDDNEQINVIEGIDVGGPNNGADRHIPSLMSLPKSGMWKLDAYFGDKLFGSVFVRVYDETKGEWKYRDEYAKDGIVLLSLAPDPVLEAGKPFGYLFHFTAPFETFEGKELAIYAYNKETGEKITAVSPIKIEEPSSGYSSLERFTATFEVPYGGLWRYEVVLDGEFYADVVLFVK